MGVFKTTKTVPLKEVEIIPFSEDRPMGEQPEAVTSLFSLINSLANSSREERRAFFAARREGRQKEVEEEK